MGTFSNPPGSCIQTAVEGQGGVHLIPACGSQAVGPGIVTGLWASFLIRIDVANRIDPKAVQGLSVLIHREASACGLALRGGSVNVSLLFMQTLKIQIKQ